jgi:hypothetical protein
MAGIRKISSEEHIKRLELYNLGLNDTEIAERLFTCAPNIQKWRTKHGLKANRFKNWDKDDKQRLELYYQGLSDDRIGKIVHRSATAIWLWRQERNLPPNNVLKAG